MRFPPVLAATPPCVVGLVAGPVARAALPSCVAAIPPAVRRFDLTVDDATVRFRLTPGDPGRGAAVVRFRVFSSGRVEELELPVCWYVDPRELDR